MRGAAEQNLAQRGSPTRPDDQQQDTILTEEPKDEGPVADVRASAEYLPDGTRTIVRNQLRTTV